MLNLDSPHVWGQAADISRHATGAACEKEDESVTAIQAINGSGGGLKPKAENEALHALTSTLTHLSFSLHPEPYSHSY